jgi:ribosomal-protein-alanine N-acetyltransferase
MRSLQLATDRLALRPLPAPAAEALPRNRAEACRSIGAVLHEEWPQPDLLNVLPRQAAASADAECFGVWVMIEGDSGMVVGDIGFHGPPDGEGAIEVGYCVVPSRRRRGYATEAAGAIVEWARGQHGVRVIVAGCDPSNVASIHTLQRVGFQRTGEANGEVRWRYGGESGEASEVS